MAINPTQPAPGLAEFQSDTIGGLVELFAGDTPAPVTISATYGADLAAAGIPAYTPVRVDFESGEIALAAAEVPADGETPAVPAVVPNAITVGVLRAGGSAEGRMAVYKAGCFNINALNWPDHLADEEDRLAAFDLASCQIYVKKPYYS